MAGIILKRNIQQYWNNIPDASKTYIKRHVPSLIGNPSGALREIAGNVITTILSHISISQWTQIIDLLNQSLEGDDQVLLQGAFSTLDRIFEDHCNELANDPVNRPLDGIVPKLIYLCSNPDNNIKFFSLRCILHLLPIAPPVLMVVINDYLKVLFALAERPPNVRILDVICRSFSSLVFSRIPAISPHMDNIIVYMINMTASSDSSIALVASDFWTTVADAEFCHHTLQNHLQSLLPVLLRGLRYSPEELQELEETQVIGPEGLESANPSYGKQDDKRSDDTFGPSQWSLRKSCGQALDYLSHCCFDADLLCILLPLCQRGLSSDDWLDREASILALGAVSDAVLSTYEHILPELIPMFLQLVDDRHPLIRSISCWSLSRYAPWITDPSNSAEFLQPVVLVLLNHVLEMTHKQVMEAACSALSVLCDEAQEAMAPFAESMIQTYKKAYPLLHRRGLIVLYDSIGSLAEAVKERMNQPVIIDTLMPPLIDQWNILSDDDPDLVPLIDCISRVATGLGPGFAQFAEPVFQRGYRVAHQIVLQQCSNQEEIQKCTDPDLNLLVSVIELMGSIVGSLGSSSADLVSKTNLNQLLIQVCRYSLYQVNRAAFMLIGELSKHSIVHLMPVLSDIIPILVNNVRVSLHISVSNNALWALGEISLTAPDQLRPWASEIVTRSTRILENSVLHRNVHQNAAILLGRLALSFSALLAERIEHLAKPWCIVLRDLDDNQEKESAFAGLLNVVNANPAAFLKDFNYFVGACTSWVNHCDAIKHSISAVMRDYKQQLGPENWTQLWNTLDSASQNTLVNDYGV
ncbi:transportin-1-like isoform X2 [Schistocerca gregaria]|nr:transportin-1-like isoform X2 [Schistocerca gregaria]